MLGLDIPNNIIAPLIVGVISAIAAYLVAKLRQQKRIDAAPRRYVEELDKLIKQAYAEGENKALVNARAIVAARNSLSESLVSISKNLNSEIDRLSTEIGAPIARLEVVSADPHHATNHAEIYQTIEVLYRFWPTKREQIEVEIRKLLAELGLPITSAPPPRDSSTSASPRQQTPSNPQDQMSSSSQRRGPPSSGTPVGT
jgi:hypothetical protein